MIYTSTIAPVRRRTYVAPVEHISLRDCLPAAPLLLLLLYHAAVEAVQDALMEQARAQEENMQVAHDDLMASFEKGVDYRLSAVKDEVGYRQTR